MVDDEAEEASEGDEEEAAEEEDYGRRGAASPTESISTQALADNIQRVMLLSSVDQASEQEKQKLARMMQGFQEVTAAVNRLGALLDDTNSQIIIDSVVRQFRCQPRATAPVADLLACLLACFALCFLPSCQIWAR